MSIMSVMPSNRFILCHPLLLLPSIFPSIRVFSNESALYIRWPKYWSVSFSISPCNEHSGLISFRIDWLYLLAVQGTLKSLLQHHSSKVSIFQHSAFFSFIYIYIYIYLLFWNYLPSSSLSHCSRLIQSPCLSFLNHRANSHWLSILHKVMLVSMLLFPYISPSTPLSPCPKVYSLCLFLHCFPVNEFFSSIFLDSVYVH